MSTPEPQGPTPDSEPTPLYREAAVRPGTAWRTAVATIKSGLLRRPVVLLVAFGIFMVLPMIGGTPWLSAVPQAIVGTLVVLVLSTGLAWLRVRRWYRTGSVWRAGIGPAGLRLVFPDNDLTLPASGIRRVRPENGLLVLTIGPRSLQLGLPEGLFSVTEIEELIARGEHETPPIEPIAATSATVAGLESGVSRRETVITPEFVQAVRTSLIRLELSRPLSLFMLAFALYQWYRVLSLGDSMSLLIAGMATLTLGGLLAIPAIQGRRLYRPGETIGAGVQDGRLSVRLGDRVIDQETSVVRKVRPVSAGVALQMANGSVAVLPPGLLTDEELVELANARRAARGR